MGAVTISFRVLKDTATPALEVANDVFVRSAKKMSITAAIFTEGKARENAFKTMDTATGARSIFSEPVGTLGARVATNLGYMLVEEEGRRPGARPPPPEALAGWARRHGFDTSRGGLFVLARAIGRRGRKGRFHMARAAESARKQFPVWIQEFEKRLEVGWRDGK